MKLIINDKTIDIVKATSFYQKLKGFMFYKKKIEHGIVFFNVNSIHTFFMRQKIDVIMTDKKYNILYKYENLKPWKIILPKKNVYYTFELPLGTSKCIMGKTLTFK